jgi:hypothetical protein
MRRTQVGNFPSSFPYPSYLVDFSAKLFTFQQLLDFAPILGII